MTHHSSHAPSSTDLNLISVHELFEIDLPAEVDLSKAKATFSDGRLEVTMPKAAPAKSVRVETKIESPRRILLSMRQEQERNCGHSQPANRTKDGFIEDHEPIAKTRAASSRVSIGTPGPKESLKWTKVRAQEMFKEKSR